MRLKGLCLLCALCRNAPAKRAVTAGFFVSASGMVGIVRWAFGTWAPGVRAVIYSRVGVWYALITGAAGVAVTYWLDNPDNYKINTSIRVALQGMALGAVYWSIADETLALAAVATIMTFGWLSAFLRWVGGWVGGCRGMHTGTAACAHSASGTATRCAQLVLGTTLLPAVHCQWLDCHCGCLAPGVHGLRAN
jgi:hypothetical protein